MRILCRFVSVTVFLRIFFSDFQAWERASVVETGLYSLVLLPVESIYWPHYPRLNFEQVVRKYFKATSPKWRPKFKYGDRTWAIGGPPENKVVNDDITSLPPIKIDVVDFVGPAGPGALSVCNFFLSSFYFSL